MPVLVSVSVLYGKTAEIVVEEVLNGSVNVATDANVV